MKISTARLKQIINEELFYREFHRKTEELNEKIESAPEGHYATSEDGRRLSKKPKSKKDAIKQLAAVEASKEDALKEGFAVSKQDLVNAGLPLGSVRSGLYDHVIVRLERVGARRGLPALKLAIRNLRSYELSDSSAVLDALEKEL